MKLAGLNEKTKPRLKTGELTYRREEVSQEVEKERTEKKGEDKTHLS